MHGIEGSAQQSDAPNDSHHDVTSTVSPSSAAMTASAAPFCASSVLSTTSDIVTVNAPASLDTIRKMLERIREILKRAGELRRAATAEYAPGLQMIDLSEGGRGDGLSRGRALVLVPEEATARVVESLARRAGYAVQRVAEPATLTAAAQGFDVSLVLAAERSLPADLPGPAGRAYRLFVLQDGDGAAARASSATEVFGLPLDPEGLARAMREAPAA